MGVIIHTEGLFLVKEKRIRRNYLAELEQIDSYIERSKRENQSKEEHSTQKGCAAWYS